MMANSEDFEIQLWSKVEGLRRWKELITGWMIYWNDEPLASPLRKNWQQKRNSDALKHMLLVNVASTPLPIVVAWDRRQKQVAGFSFARVEHSPELLQKHPELSTNALANLDSFDFDDDTKRKLKCLREFYGEAARQAHVFSRYKTDKIWLNSYGNALPEYRAKGIFQLLSWKLIELALDHGFHLMLGNMASKYSTDVALKNPATDKVVEVEYKDNYALYDEMPDEIKDVHRKLTVVVIKLDHVGQTTKSKL